MAAMQTEVSAILGEEFYALLDALGVRAAFDAGRCRCDNCHAVVGSSNVLLVFPKGGREVAFLCAKPGCAMEYGTAPDGPASSRVGVAL